MEACSRKKGCVCVYVYVCVCVCLRSPVGVYIVAVVVVNGGRSAAGPVTRARTRTRLDSAVDHDDRDHDDDVYRRCHIRPLAALRPPSGPLLRVVVRSPLSAPLPAFHIAAGRRVDTRAYVRRVRTTVYRAVMWTLPPPPPRPSPLSICQTRCARASGSALAAALPRGTCAFAVAPQLARPQQRQRQPQQPQQLASYRWRRSAPATAAPRIHDDAPEEPFQQRQQRLQARRYLWCALHASARGASLSRTVAHDGHHRRDGGEECNGGESAERGASSRAPASAKRARVGTAAQRTRTAAKEDGGDARTTSGRGGARARRPGATAGADDGGGDGGDEAQSAAEQSSRAAGKGRRRRGRRRKAGDDPHMDELDEYLEDDDDDDEVGGGGGGGGGNGGNSTHGGKDGHAAATAATTTTAATRHGHRAHDRQDGDTAMLRAGKVSWLAQTDADRERAGAFMTRRIPAVELGGYRVRRDADSAREASRSVAGDRHRVDAQMMTTKMEVEEEEEKARRYGTCGVCGAPLAIPGLSASYCAQCGEWIY